MLVRRCVVSVVLLLAAALLVCVGSPAQRAAAADPPCTVDALLVNSCRPWFGATSNGYAEAPADAKEQALYFEQRVGRQMDMVHLYHGVGSNSHTLNATDLYFANRPNTLVYLNWPLTNTFSTAAGDNATVNGYIDQMARSIQSLGDKKILLALHHEPENDISATCPGQSTKPGTMGTAADYVAMWRNVRARFDALHVTNVVWVMNYMNFPAYDCMIGDLWPGNDLVDYVSFNGYQATDRDVSFVKRVGRFYDLLTANSTPEHDYASKEWGLVEWGIHSSTQPSTYLYYQQAKQAVENKVFPRLRFYMVFDNGDRTRNIFDFQVAYDRDGVLDPREQQEFNLFANSWALTGDGTPGEQPPPPPADVTPPSTPGSVSAALSGSSPVVSWDAASDDVGVTSYDVLRNGTVIGSTATLTYTDTTAAQGSTYSYTVQARDAAGNVSPASGAATVTVPDTTAPGAPAFLRVSRSSTRATLSWGAAIDNVGVSAYLVYRSGTLVTTLPSSARTTSVAGLRSGTSYTFSVRARDAAGNLGAARSATG